MKFEKVIEGRRSIRRYEEKPIDQEVIRKIIKAAGLAPSWKNSQCPRWYVVTNDQLLAELKENALPDFNKNNAQHAACLIIAAFKKGLSGMNNDGTYANDCTEGWSYFDLGLATENLCLEAYAQGLGTLIMGIRNDDVIRSVLKVPDDQQIAAVIALGTPAIDPKKPKRLKLKENTVFFE